jgi:hypothetical protein
MSKKSDSISKKRLNLDIVELENPRASETEITVSVSTCKEL